MRKRIIIVLLILAHAAIFYWAGLRAGEATGRGWKGAMLEAGCRLRCPMDKETPVLLYRQPMLLPPPDPFDVRGPE